VLARSGSFSAARREFRQAGAVYGRRGDDARVKKITANLGDSYREQGNAEDAWGHGPQARFYWKQALRVYRVALGLGDGDAIDALLLAGIAECELRLGDPLAAQAFVAMALEAAGDCPSLLAPCHLWESQVLKALGELKAAERAGERARRAAEHLEHGDMLARCLLAQSAIADQQGRVETAADLAKRAREIAADRAALMAEVRGQLAQLWHRYTGAGARDIPRAAA
jgi:tetratricopeptide (TPR) repeat protein